MDPTAGPEDISVIASNLPIDIDQRSLEQVFSRCVVGGAVQLRQGRVCTGAGE
jgi:hypothetical protein